MPVVPSSFRPPFFLRNGHVQTILPVLLPRRLPVSLSREILELADGDFLTLDWARSGHGKIAILTHGLEGDTSAGYIRGTALALRAAGWDSLAWNFRGCGEPNRLLRFYHSGETTDLSAVVRHAATQYQHLALIGFSLGGNLILKYLGEAPPHPAIRGAVAVSAPIDLASSARKLDREWRNRIYLRRFLKTLIAKVEAKAPRFPGQLETGGIRRIVSFQEFDGRYTAPLHGFRDAEDYWTRCSARQFLPALTVPALLLSALNDPFLAPECFPFAEAEASPNFFLEAPASGGHVGFLDLKHGLQPWSERRIVEFFESGLDPHFRKCGQPSGTQNNL